MTSDELFLLWWCVVMVFLSAALMAGWQSARIDASIQRKLAKHYREKLAERYREDGVYDE